MYLHEPVEALVLKHSVAVVLNVDSIDAGGAEHPAYHEHLQLAEAIERRPLYLLNALVLKHLPVKMIELVEPEPDLLGIRLFFMENLQHFSTIVNPDRILLCFWIPEV